MNRYEERFIYNFWELIPHEEAGANYRIISLTGIYAYYDGLVNDGDILPPQLRSLYKWLSERQVEGVDNSLIDAVLAYLQAENPEIYESKNSSLSDEEHAIAISKFVSWFWKYCDYYEMRAALLNHTADELLAQVQAQVITERKEDADKGQDVTAESDMPISTTFSGVLASPTTIADKMSALRLADRDYSHKWKDQVDTKEDRFTLPEKIQLALDTWDDMIKEWSVAFLDQFSITPSDEWEDLS